LFGHWDFGFISDFGFRISNFPFMSVALILLAAGGSTRMGRAKQLLPYRGTTLLRHAATTALASRCRPVVVVVGSQADAMRSALADLPLEIVENANWARGMGTSIREGLNTVSLNPVVAAVVVMLCDQPAVTAELIDTMIDRHESTRSPIVASFYLEIAGVPALFDRSMFDELLRLEDAAGARQVIHRHSAVVASIPFVEGAADLDTPEDYQRSL